MDDPTLAQIKNSIENWKYGANRAYPMLLTWEQIHWMVRRIEELELASFRTDELKLPTPIDPTTGGKSGAW